MKPLLYPTYLGRSWILRNESMYPDAEVVCLVGAAVEATRSLDHSAVVYVKDAGARANRHYSGNARDRRRHTWPEWISGHRRPRYYMRLTIPPPDWDGYGRPRVCWHSTALRALSEEEGGSNAALARVADLYARGDERLGRWPIYVIQDWRECLVHLAAHEACHLAQFDGDRKLSEVACEEFADHVLNQFRAARPCGDEPGSSTVSGLVAGPAPPGPTTTTNRKEPTVATQTETAADPKAEMQDLFKTLLDAAKNVAPKTQTVKKAAYVRVDVLLGEKHKTLAYLNHPTTKSVRVEVPKKGGGGYDVIKVTKAAEVEKAVKAVRANHDRIVAQAGS